MSTSIFPFRVTALSLIRVLLILAPTIVLFGVPDRTGANYDLHIVTRQGTLGDGQAMMTVGSCDSLPGGVIEVQGTGGSGIQPTGYGTLAAAFTAINNGVHTGDIDIDVCGNSLSEPVGGATLNASGNGAASYTSIDIIPVGGAARTISGAATAGSALITLNGADNVKIDGLNTGGNSLTISNTTASNTSGTSTIRLVGDATNNTITNASILGSANMASGTNGGNIWFSTASGAGGTGNDGNIISNNFIGPAGGNLPSKGIYSSGTTTSITTYNSGVTITGNSIADAFGASVQSAAIYLAGGTTDWTISNNKIFQTATRTQATATIHAGIHLASANINNCTVSGNTIGFSSSAGTGVYDFVGVGANSRFYPIYVSQHGTTAASQIQGNTVTAISVTGPLSGTGTSAPFAGIMVSAADAPVNIGTTAGNLVGSTTASGAINVSSSSTTADAQTFGIHTNTASAQPNIAANTVAGITVNNTAGSRAMTFFGIGATTTSTGSMSVTDNFVGAAAGPITNNAVNSGSRTIGIATAIGTATVTGNTVANLTMAAGTASTGANAPMIGLQIDGSGSSGGMDISRNTIRSLSVTENSSNNAVYGVYYTGPTGTNTVARNLIHSLSAPNSPTGNPIGIYVQGGNTTFQNNMIALGEGATNGQLISGINEISGTNRFFHNSVYIGGSGVGGSSNTFAFNSVLTGFTRQYRDNVFQNARSNGAGTGKHYAIQVGGAGANPAGLTTNNNVLFANGTGGHVGRFNNVDRTTLANWQTATGQDANSFSSDPKFSAPAAATPDLHINPASPTAVEAGGADVGAADDFDGQGRGGLTPVDIGADAGNFTSTSAMNVAPVINTTPPATATEDTLYTYTPSITDPDGPGQAWTLLGTHTCGGSIVAGTGVVIFTPAGPIPPASCVLAVQVCDGGTPNLCAQQTATVNITAVNDPPVTVDDNLSTLKNVPLVVAASVLTANDSDPDGPSLTVTAVSNAINGSVGIAAGTVTFTPAANFTGIASFEYTVSDGSLIDVGLVTVQVNSPNFSGAFSVGAGETYTSLTNNGGLFEAMNAGTFSDNVVVNLTSDLTAETGTHALNQQNETGAGGYTIFFQASGGQRLISGGNATALIRLNGADRVTFSGLAFGPGGIGIRNTGNGATVLLVNDSSNNSILSCVVEGGTTSNVSAVVMFGAGPTTGNDNNSVTDSVIRDRTDAVAIPVRLFASDSSGGAVNSGTVVLNNQFINFTQAAIFDAIAENTSITGNTISQTAARTTGLFPIQMLANAGSNSISGNTIRDQSTTSSFVGINLQSNTGSVNASANRIYNIDNAGGSFAPFAGIQFIGNDAGSSLTVVNNMVSIAPATASNQTVYGVTDARSAGTLSMSYNSVLVGGTGGPATSWAFRRESGSASTVSLTGNIFFNARVGGADSFAIGDASAGAGVWSSNYDLYVGTGTVPANFFEIGGTPVDFAVWKAGPPARDANSIASVAGAGPFNVSNIFVSANDLHLRTTGNNPAINAGVDTGLTTDIDGQTRPFNGAPDIGADEVQSAPTAAEVSISGRAATADGRGIRNVRVLVTGGGLPEPRMAVTNAFGYYRIDGLTAGQTYLVSVGGKRFLFTEAVRVVSPGDDAFDIDFVGEARW